MGRYLVAIRVVVSDGISWHFLYDDMRGEREVEGINNVQKSRNNKRERKFKEKSHHLRSGSGYTGLHTPTPCNSLSVRLLFSSFSPKYTSDTHIRKYLSPSTSRPKCSEPFSNTLVIAIQQELQRSYDRESAVVFERWTILFIPWTPTQHLLPHWPTKTRFGQRTDDMIRDYKSSSSSSSGIACEMPE